MSNENKYYPDCHFQELTASINKAIIRNDGLIGDQQAQVELVCQLERKFKQQIQKHKQCLDIYAKFIDYILNERKNILSAKPYFREKSNVFNQHINTAIRENKPLDLFQYAINFQLIDFIYQNWEGVFPEKANKIRKEFLEARRILIENNLPLAINRAKLFLRKVARNQLDLLDLIDMCAAGLVSGVDKYIGEYTPVWRSVCISRMVGNMISEYSETFLRLYPTDRKILYRANSLQFRLKIYNTEELAKAVTESFELDRAEGRAAPQLPITEVQIRTLMASSNYVSADSKIDDEGNTDEQLNGANVYDYTACTDNTPEEEAIQQDMYKKTGEAIDLLAVPERKVIKLKGVKL